MAYLRNDSTLICPVSHKREEIETDCIEAYYLEVGEAPLAQFGQILIRAFVTHYLHKFIHLREPNHTDAFWSFVAEHDPDYEAHARWLEENRTRLIFSDEDL